jgi:hypothetical protein
MLETFYTGTLTGYSNMWYVGASAQNGMRLSLSFEFLKSLGIDFISLAGGYQTAYPSDLFQFDSYMSGNTLNLCITRTNGNNWGQYLKRTSESINMLW